LKNYSAFLSYCSSDRKRARRLQRTLETFVLPRVLRAEGQPARPFKNVFRDEDELLPGGDLPARLKTALAASEHLIVLWTPAAAASPWVRKEIIDFVRLGRRNQIVVLLSDEFSGVTDLPLELLYELNEDGVESTRPLPEPLYVSWRDRQLDRRPFLRLAASLLKLSSLDELVRRDARRRSWGAARAGAAVLALLGFLFASVYFAALLQRDAIAQQVRQLVDISALAENRGDTQSATRFALAATLLAERSWLPLDDNLGRAELSRAINAATENAQHIASAQLDHSQETWAARFSPDGQTIATASWDGTARLWRPFFPEGGSVTLAHPQKVSLVRFSPDGEILATAAWDEHIRLWDIETRRIVREIDLSEAGSLSDFAFSPDGTQFASCAGNYCAIWRTSDESPLMEFFGEDTLSRILFAPDGSSIVMSGVNHGRGIAEVKSLGDGGVWEMRIRHENVVTQVEFSPDGSLLLSGSQDGAVSITSTSDGRPPFDTVRMPAAISDATFNHRGDLFAAATIEGEAGVYSAATGAVSGDGIAHSATILSIAFSPDDRILATGGSDGFIRLWDGRTGRPIAAPLPHAGEIADLDFSPDGEHLVSASSDGTVKLWSLSIQFAPARALSICDSLLANGGGIFADSDLTRVPFIRYHFNGDVCRSETEVARRLRQARQAFERPARDRHPDYFDGADGRAADRN